MKHASSPTDIHVYLFDINLIKLSCFNPLPLFKESESKTVYFTVL